MSIPSITVSILQIEEAAFAKTRAIVQGPGSRKYPIAAALKQPSFPCYYTRVYDQIGKRIVWLNTKSAEKRVPGGLAALSPLAQPPAPSLPPLPASPSLPAPSPAPTSLDSLPAALFPALPSISAWIESDALARCMVSLGLPNPSPELLRTILAAAKNMHPSLAAVKERQGANVFELARGKNRAGVSTVYLFLDELSQRSNIKLIDLSNGDIIDPPKGVPLVFSKQWIDRDTLRNLIQQCLTPEIQPPSDDQIEAILTYVQKFPPYTEKSLYISEKESHLFRSLLGGQDLQRMPTVYLLMTQQGDRLIGKGGEGEVRLCIDLKNKTLCAVKIRRPKDGGKDWESTLVTYLQESQSMSALQGERGIIKLYSDHCSHTHKECYLVMEYCPSGDLFTQLITNKNTIKYSKKRLFQFTLDIAKGLCAIHKRGWSHRDVKLKNVLTTEKDFAVLIDFSQVKHLGFSQAEDRAGTYFSWSPEKCKELLAPSDEGIDHQKDDLWAFGQLMYELFSNNHSRLIAPQHEPGGQSSPEDLRYYLRQVALFDNPAYLPLISNPDIHHLLMQIFTKETRPKLTMDWILQQLQKIYDSKWGEKK
jgi:hypothetical protein